MVHLAERITGALTGLDFPSVLALRFETHSKCHCQRVCSMAHSSSWISFPPFFSINAQSRLTPMWRSSMEGGVRGTENSKPFLCSNTPHRPRHISTHNGRNVVFESTLTKITKKHIFTVHKLFVQCKETSFKLEEH